MEPYQWAGIAALLLLTVLMAVASAASAALPRLNKGHLKHLSAEGVGRANDVLRLVDSPRSTTTTLTVANAASTVLVAGLGASLEGHYFGSSPVAFFIGSVLGLGLILVIQLAAQSAGQLHPDSMVLSLLRSLQVIDLLLGPVTLPLRALARLLVRGDADRPAESGHASDDDLRMVVDAVEEDSTLQEDEREMIHSIVEMGETTAREIMVPRVDVAAVEASEPLRRVLDIVMARGHSRIPIYEESIDNIVGIVYAKDLLRHMQDGSLDVPARTLGRQPHFIPESKKTDELLKEMQTRKVHMAVVLDEYGGTSGIVTIEDLLEEIVGEIQDEYDTEELSIERVSDQEAVFDARVNVREVSETLDVELEDGEYDTVGGLVYDRLGKIPVVGDEVQFDGLSLKVLSTVGKRIKKVRIRVDQDTGREQTYSG